MSKISHMLTEKILPWGNYQNSNREIIECAISIFLWECSTFISSLSVAYLLFGKLLPTLVFALCFALLRQFAGGVHAQTHVRCLLSTVVIFVFAMLIIDACNNSILIHCLGVFAWIGVWRISPIHSRKKQLTISQHVKNEKQVHKILILQLLFFILSQNINHEAASATLVAVIMVFVLQIPLMISNNGLNRVFHCKLRSARLRIAQGFLAVCLSICYANIQNVSLHWNYQEELPDDLHRKIENR
nr:accessory gene regulator B family protein [uncultured Agathobaculum sp.]